MQQSAMTHLPFGTNAKKHTDTVDLTEVARCDICSQSCSESTSAACGI